MVLAFVKEAREVLTLKHVDQQIIDYKNPNMRNILDGNSKEDVITKFKTWLDSQQTKNVQQEIMYINDVVLSKFTLKYPNWKGAYHVENEDYENVANKIYQETGLKVLYCGNGDEVNLKYAFIGIPLFDNSKESVVKGVYSTKRVDIPINDFIEEYDRLENDSEFGLVSHHLSPREEYHFISVGISMNASDEDHNIAEKSIPESESTNWGTPIYGLTVKDGQFFVPVTKEEILEKYKECKNMFVKAGIKSDPVIILSMTNEDQ